MRIGRRLRNHLTELHPHVRYAKRAPVALMQMEHKIMHNEGKPNHYHMLVHGSGDVLASGEHAVMKQSVDE